MSYSDATFAAGRLYPKASSTSGATPSLRSAEIAANASDGCLFVGTTGGSATAIPGSPTIRQIVTLTEAQYTAITASVSSTTLYIVTPNP